MTQRKPRRPATTSRAEEEGGNEGERLRRLKEKYARCVLFWFFGVCGSGSIVVFRCVLHEPIPPVRLNQW